MSPRGSAAAMRTSSRASAGSDSDALGVDLFDLVADRLTVGQPDILPRGPSFFHARCSSMSASGFPSALLDDPIAYRRIKRTVDVVAQQRTRVAVIQPVYRYLGQPGQHLVAGPGTRGAQDRDPLRGHPAGNEREDLRRGFVKPLRVVNDADKRSALGELREQRQRGEPDEKPVRWRSETQAEYGLERFALRDRQPLEVAEHRGAELVQAAEGELHLRLHPGGRGDVPAVGPGLRVAEQCALADARVAAQDQDPARAGRARPPAGGRAPDTPLCDRADLACLARSQQPFEPRGGFARTTMSGPRRAPASR